MKRVVDRVPRPLRRPLVRLYLRAFYWTITDKKGQPRPLTWRERAQLSEVVEWGEGR